MLHSLDRLRSMEIRTSDPEPRTMSVVDLLFEEADLVVRYLVVDTGTWLPGRKVLVSPEAVIAIDDAEQVLHTNLAARVVEEAPTIDADVPVSLEHRRALARHYGWSAYTSFHPILGGYGWMRAGDVPPPDAGGIDERRVPPLRSADEVIGYDVHGTDEGIGTVDDLLVDAATWALRYVVVDTRKWLPFSRKVLVPVAHLRAIAFLDRSVSFDLTRDRIEACPEFDGSLPMATEDELAVLEAYEKAPV